MDTEMYVGEDIGALVFDVGSYSVRAGYAEDDCPRHEISSLIGIQDDGIVDSGMIDDLKQNKPSGQAKYFMDTQTYVARKGMRIANFMKDGMVEDWDLFEKLMDYVYETMMLEGKDNPVLMSESPSNLPAKREKLTEIMFEKYKIPAFFLVKDAVLTAFASGRVTAVVVDSGATHTTAVAVHDGYVLSNAIVKSPLGGDYITMQCKQYLQENGVDMTPQYMIASKESVRGNEKPIWVKKNNLPEVTPSYHNYMVKRLIQDFQHNVLQVSEIPYDEKIVSSLPTVHYEFPNGYHQDFGKERFKVSEILFDPPSNLGGSMLGVGNLVTTSVGMCDTDIRPALYNNVIVTGGNSAIEGFDKRLNKDLSSRVSSSIRLKVIATNTVKDRRNNPWIGGSILASIGTFQQLWISSEEYYEVGKSQVHRKCP